MSTAEGQQAWPSQPGLPEFPERGHIGVVLSPVVPLGKQLQDEVKVSSLVNFFLTEKHHLSS